jgi:hypothetical protein
MSYHYAPKSRERVPEALPNVEVFDAADYAGEHAEWYCGKGFYYAWGFPWCLWDSDPVGAFDTYEGALVRARLEAE